MDNDRRSPNAEHIADNPTLVANPTNLHTHGLIVEPHRAEGPNDPYGDYVFVELRNPANAGGTCTPTTHTGHGLGHPDMDVACRVPSTMQFRSRPTIRQAISGSIRTCTASP